MAGRVIEVDGLHKGFRVPSAKPRRRLGLRRHSQRTTRLELFEGLDFSVEEGEFFGVVGRNGSGKSSLLRLLAGIYKPDRGTVRVEGRVIPLIDIGAGFSPELSAAENVLFNAVLMGMTPGEARERAESIFEFAELGGTEEQIVSNLSAGGRLRLAFATMLAARPDVLLLDEVLAVGDAGFQQKCALALEELQAEGCSVVLVTHSMAEVERLCSRAMLLDEGQIAAIGDPGEVTRRYLELTVAGQSSIGLGARAWADAEEAAIAIEELDLLDSRGRVSAALQQNEPIRLRLGLRSRSRLEGLGVRLELRSARGARIFLESRRGIAATSEPLVRDERLDLELELGNPLMPGEYSLRLGIFRVGRGGGEVPIAPAEAIGFIVEGESSRRGGGMVSLPLSTRIAGKGAPARRSLLRSWIGRR